MPAGARRPRSRSFLSRAVIGRPDKAEVAYSSRGFEKRRESGDYVTIGCVNVGPDAEFTHPSDGFIDLVIARRGGFGTTLGLLTRYVLRFTGITNERHSSLLTYVKARSVVITPNPEASVRYQCVNVDGEALAGPGPFRLHLLPSFLTAFGEY
jgi:hypothetical protein